MIKYSIYSILIFLSFSFADNLIIHFNVFNPAIAMYKYFASNDSMSYLGGEINRADSTVTLVNFVPDAGYGSSYVILLAVDTTREPKYTYCQMSGKYYISQIPSKIDPVFTGNAHNVISNGTTYYITYNLKWYSGSPTIDGYLPSTGDSILIYGYKSGPFLDLDGGTYYKIEITDIQSFGNTSNQIFQPTEDDLNFTVCPNPFNSSTLIRYLSSNQNIVSINIFDLNGVKVSSLFQNHSASSNQHSIIFNARNLTGGIYVCKILTSRSILTKRLILLK
jgi:hypothetical protein